MNPQLVIADDQDLKPREADTQDDTSESGRSTRASDLAGVLHDLGQPLAAIRALVSTPFTEPAAGGDDEMRKRLHQIGELAEWMNELLRCSTAIGPLTGEPTASDAGQVVRETVVTAGASFDGTLQYVGSGPALVPVCPVELRRAVANVVDNATRAAGSHGCVEVRVCRSGRSVHVEIEDDGPGFGRVRGQTRRGLAVTRSVLDGCGGALKIARSRTGGVVIRLEFPLVPAETATSEYGGTCAHRPL